MKIVNILKARSVYPKLKTKLIVSFLAISIIMSSISYFIVYYGIMNILEKQNEEYTMQQFRQAEYNIKNLMNNVEKISKTIMTEQQVQDWLDQRFISDFDKFSIMNSVYFKMSEIMSNYGNVDSIYLYGGDGHILGTSGDYNYYLNDKQKEDWFYKSGLYQSAVELNGDLYWYGTYSSKQFDFSEMGLRKTNIDYLLTATKNIRSLNKSEVNAVLVINIEEKYLLSTYNNNPERQSNNSMYIIDNLGSIVSHADQNLIGTISDVKEYIKQSSPDGSFTINRKSGMTQVVYSKLNRPDWILVNEIPYNVFINNILLLRKTLTFVAIVSLALISILSLYWIYKITKPLEGLLNAMKQMQKGNLDVELRTDGRNEFDILDRQFNKMSRSIGQLIDKVKAVENEKRQHEIENLQAQINPHFLYNTLNAIKWMAVAADHNNISDSLTALGNLLKPIFKSDSILWSINEEIEYIKNYIKLMNCRYGECITLQYDIPDSVRENMIPRFILQPLIENSIVHCITGTVNGLDICISAKAYLDILIISVADNGKGITLGKLSEIKTRLLANESGNTTNKKSIGIINVNRRIKLQSGEYYGINIESIPGEGTKLEIKLPVIQKT